MDMEKNIYIQEQTLVRMNRQRKSLGNRNNFAFPTHYKADPEYGFFMLKSGAICAIIGWVIDIVINWSRFWDHDGIFAIILAPLHGLLLGMGAGLAGALIIGPIIAIMKGKKEQNELDANYKYERLEYDKMEKEDLERVKNELIIKDTLQKDIDALERKSIESKNRLKTFYQYNVIHPKYWHDLVAICSFYQYLTEKRTYCLEFNPQNGDRGAYNIYNEELQRGIIISQLNVVINKLDQVLDNQHTLQRTLTDANNKIDYLSENLNSSMRRIDASIQEQTAIQKYNSERTQAELEFMNVMNILYHWRK